MTKSFLRDYSLELEDALLGIIGEYAGFGVYKLVFSRTKRRHLGKILIVERGGGSIQKITQKQLGENIRLGPNEIVFATKGCASGSSCYAGVFPKSKSIRPEHRDLP